MSRPHLLFVTGKLAEPALRRTLAKLAPRAGFDYSVTTLPITVALAATPWIARHLVGPDVRRIFAYRKEKMGELFGAPSEAGEPSG